MIHIQISGPGNLAKIDRAFGQISQFLGGRAKCSLPPADHHLQVL